MKLSYTSRILIVAMFAFVLASCGDSDKAAKLAKLKTQQAELAKTIATLESEIAAANPEAVSVRMKGINISELAARKFDFFVQTQGMVEAEDNILVSAKSMGIITAVFVKEGQRVSRGQVLAQIDNSITESSIAEVKSSLNLAKIVYEKQRKLWDQQIGTEIQFLQAKNNKESLEARLATLNEQLDMARIKSPINGTVEAVNIKIGENAAPGAPAFRVININDLKVTANVSEAYVTAIDKGNKVQVILPDLDKKIDGSVNFVGRNIDPLSRSFPIEVKLPSQASLRPSMTAILRVVYKSVPNALCVPINLVQNINGKKIVYVAEMDGKQLVARRKEVSVGGVYDNLAEITGGLNVGDKIITVGYQGLNDGEFVKI
ncbi:MAG: efflux RND transporter periplasmic adaptor subunit [Cyclobacteriaceae bacterium]|nr:efflux RND transporter periplasmic adaptor subunit [Cyclobacteriaceae bacterium]